MSVRGVLPVSSSSSTVVVAVDVGKRSFAVSVTAADRRRLFGPVEVAMTRPAVSELIGRICAVLPSPLPPAGRVQILTTVPGWGVIRAANYGAAIGDPGRWPSPRQIYRAAGLSPTQYESAGRRRDGQISREGSVELRRALIELGVGLWLSEPASRTYADGLRARGKRGGIIACALAHRANRIAYALVRDQTSYNPTRWQPQED